MKRLVALLALVPIAPMVHPLYFWGAHDGRHSVYFLVQFDRSIRDGIWWPRWAPDFTYGYGYPIFNIYAPLAYFIGEAFHLAGADVVTAVKLVFALSFPLSGLTMFAFARDTLGSRGAALAAVVYMLAPYRLVDVYVRGALSESLAFVFFPLTLFAFRRVLAAAELRRIVVAASGEPARWRSLFAPTMIAPTVLAAVSLGALLLTHTTIGLLMIPVTAAYVAWTLARMARSAVTEAPRPIVGLRDQFAEALRAVAPGAVGSLFAATLAAGLAAIFLIPSIAEYQYVRVDQWTTAAYDYRAHFVYPHQLVSPYWGFGVSDGTPDSGMPFQLGVIPVALGALGLVASERRGVRAEQFFFGGLAVVSVFLMLHISAPVWEALRIAALVQFPWRLLTFTTLAMAYLAGMIVSGPMSLDRTSDANERVAFVGAVIAALIAAQPMLNPQMIEPAEGPVSLGALMRFQQSSGELVGLTRWNLEKPNDSPLKPLYEAGLPIRSKIDPASVPPG
ncbi:MAG: hypothetical protein NZ518_05460, partial [Dehalococcoidia bacterium]|nr:hypothetical protein [Dehalococcoidia bacterium]